MKLLLNLYHKIMDKKLYRILFLVLLSIGSTISIFLVSLKSGHDINFHLSRIIGIKDGLKMGILPSVYTKYLFGYGYANPLFYPDIFLYIPAIMHYLGASITLSYKTFLFIISIASIFTMYITVKGISKSNFAAIISSIIYGFSSYRLLDMFIRSALGETIAFIFTPLVIYGIYKIVFDDYKQFYILVIGMSGLILSHLISTFIIAIILIIFCLINIKKFFEEKARIKYLIIAALVTFLITSSFILPMLEQILSQSFAFNDISNIGLGTLSERAVPIYSLFIEIIINRLPWIPAGVGIVFIFLVILSIKYRKKSNKFINECFIIGVIFWIICCDIFPWKIFNNTALSLIQFPWRFYLIPTLLISLAGGILIEKIYKSDKSRVIIMLVIIVLSGISCGLINGRVLFKADAILYDYYTIGSGEYLPAKADLVNIGYRGDIITANHDLTFTHKRVDNKFIIDFENSYNDTKLELPLLYYKGYVANIGNEKIPVTESENGLVLVELNDKKSGTIVVEYKKTTLGYITQIISIVSFIAFIGYIYITSKSKSS